MANPSETVQKAPLESAIEYVLTFDGQDDFVELPPASIPSGNEITCSFWAYGGEALPKDNSVIEAWSANNQRILNIHLIWNNSFVFFDCGNSDASFDSYDRLMKQINAADCKGKWSHWAFTKNATTGAMKIYLNGELWHQEMGKTIAIPPTAKARLGSSFHSNFYPGRLAEVQLWNRDRTQAEIQQDMPRRLRGDEPGLVSYWPLNEGTGAIAHDKTSNAHHGTIHGNPSWVSTLSLSPATPSPSKKEEASSSPTKDQKMPLKPAIEYALTFDGQNDFITCPDGIVTNSYTKEAWVKLSEPLAASNNILSGHDHAFFMPNGCLQAGHNGQWGQVKDANISPVNTWLHVAVTYDSQTQIMCLYRDGHLVSQASNVPPFNPSDRTLLIGSHVSQNLFKGQMAEARVWNKVLSQSEIQSNLSRRLVGNEAGLMGYWPLNEESGAIAHDQTNNAYHGIIHGNPSWEVSTLSLAPVPSRQPAVTQNRPKLLVFDANSQGIAVGSGALRPQGRFTIEAWVYPATDAGKQVILAEGETRFYLEGGELKFQTTPTTEAISSSGAGLVAGKWYHVAVVRGGSRPGNTKLYINGVANDNQTAISPVLSFGNTYLGGDPDVPDSGFQGKLLEVRVWRFARSLSEIEANRLYPMTGRELGLVRYWSLTQTVGSTLHDKTTNRAVGTLSSDAVWEEVEIPLKLKLDPQERLTRSTGLEDYGYWYKEMAKQQKTEADPPFLRGRIWA